MQVAGISDMRGDGATDSNDGVKGDNRERESNQAGKSETTLLRQDICK